MTQIIELTEKFIQSVKPSESRQVYTDIKVKALKLTIHPSGRRTFSVRFNTAGKEISRKLGDVDELTVRGARDAARDLYQLYSIKNEDVKPIDKASYVTVSDIFSLYKKNQLDHLRTIAGREHTTVAAYKNHIHSSIGDLPIKLVTKKFAHNFFAELANTKGVTTHNKCLSCLRATFNYVMEFEDDISIPVNPIKGIKRLRESVRTRYLSKEEGRRFLAALDQLENQDFADIYRLALFTGARLSNVKSMQWQDINLSANVWLIPASSTKTKIDYELPLIGRAIEVLKKRLANKAGQFVFPSNGKYGYRTGGDNHWKHALKLAGLYHESHVFRPRPHDLRRTMATWQLEAGVDISIVSKSLGHTELKHTMIYAKASVDLLRDGVEKAFDF